MLLVKCPMCLNDMKYAPSSKSISKKKKRCVYCGVSFLIYPKKKDNRIVKKV